MFYIRESRAMLEFFLFTKEWPRYLQISDSAYGCVRKFVNTRAFLRYSKKSELTELTAAW